MEKVLAIIAMILSICVPIITIIMPLISIYVGNTGINPACIMLGCFTPIFILIPIAVIGCGKEECN